MIEENEMMKNTLSKQGYEYIGPIGEGAFSSVHLCKSKKYDQHFAVKRVAKQKLSEYEYNALISLDHPNIIKLYISFADEVSQYLVMEYCPNGTFRNRGGLSSDKFVYYSKQIISALAYCHSKNIAHRDIKPDNIFLDEYDHCKLADFGLAQQYEANETSTEKCGTLMFCSPEILRHDEICPFEADIWALGITFFYMATGKCPFPNSNSEELRRSIIYGELDFTDTHIDSKIRYLISKMTSRNRKQRPTAEQLLKFDLFSPVNNLKVSRSSALFNVKNKLKMPYYNSGYSSDLHATKLSKSSQNWPPEARMSSNDIRPNATLNGPYTNSAPKVPAPNAGILAYRANILYPNVNRMSYLFNPKQKPK